MKAAQLVVDSGPLIKSLAELLNISQNLITVPEVVAEIKDEKSRKAIDGLPFKLQVRTPSEKSMKKGDYSVLSLTDLKVIALTLELAEKHPDSQIRSEPLPIAVIGKRPESHVQKLTNQLTEVEIQEEAEVEKQEETEVKIQEEPEVKIQEEPELKIQEEPELKIQEEAELKIQEEAELELPEKLEIQNNDTTHPRHSNEESFDQASVAKLSATASYLSHEDIELSDSDGGEWITPENINKKRTDIEKTVNVACTTTDFAMQNVLMQMNLHLISLSHAIKRQQHWVLRCHACYHVCMDLKKSFCPKCGNNTLTRVTATVKNGQMTLFLKKNYQVNNRGTQYSIPKQKGGRTNAIILREDQKEHLHALKLAKRFEKKAMALDLADLDSLVFSKDRAILSGAGRPIIGHGRKNVNHVQGRRRK